MKKIYTLFALAATMTATAAVVRPNMPDFKTIETATFNSQVEKMDKAVAPNADNGMKKAPATPNLNGIYEYAYYKPLASNAGWAYVAMQLEKVSETEVNVYGFCYDFPVKATYDASEMSLTFTQQEIVPAQMLTADALNFYPIKYDLEPRDDGNTYLVNPQIYPVKLYYLPNGVATTSGGTMLVGGWCTADTDENMYTFSVNTQANYDDGNNSGYVFSWQRYPMLFNLDEVYPKAPSFTYDASEWTYIGESEFKDGWIAPLITGYFGYSVTDWKVKTMRNNANPKEYLLMNVYGQGCDATILSINSTPNMEGYIYLDATNPDCVIVRPNIMSGFSSEDLMDTTADFLLTSKTAIAYALEDEDIQDLIDDAADFGDELPNLSEGVITVPDCLYQAMGVDLKDGGYWVNADKETIEMRAVITLPDEAGVEGVIVDNNNAPVRYYNLQGMEVRDAEAGQVVIVKQGGKSYKTIVR